MAGDPRGSADAPEPIATPDRRLRVFVSSTLEELAPERAAVRAAVRGLRLTPVMFDLGARAHPPRELYRAYLEQSDVFVGVYGERYGWIAPDMDVSGLEDEYDLSAGRPRLLYVRRVAPGREPRLDALITRIQAESGASTTPYDDAADLAERVADDLAVLLTERFAHSAAAPPGPAPGWLPTPATALVDRRAELALVTGLLDDPAVRLVTISGPGGIGKTRLALAAAQALADGRDAVRLVDLQSVRDPGDVPAAVAAALGVPVEGRRPVLERVADRLAGSRVLLLVDNLEQVLGAVPDLAQLLARCPGTQLLVTSRRILRLRGEHDVPLGPLGLPRAGDAEGIAGAPAVELFLARARQADPAFELDAAAADAVAEVVRRLEGLPLAIELVAARVRTLPPAALLRRLDSALDVRGPGPDVPDRQRTLRATVAWSHDLLDEQERALLARLSVCSGGATLDTVEALAGPDDGALDVADVLSSLVGHSLVTPTDTGEGEPRFRMLELVRAFAAERLRERGEESATRERLAVHLAKVSAAAADGLVGSEGALWAARLEAEAPDLLAALRWSVAADRADLAVGLAAPLARWWWARGLLGTMGQIADATADLPSATRLDAAAAGRLLWARGATRIALGRLEEAAPLFDALLAGARSGGDPWLLGHALTGSAMTRSPDDPQLPALLAEGVAELRRSGDTWSVVYGLVPLGDVALLSGDVAGAVAAHEEGLRLARGIGDEHLVATLLDQLALDALLAGDAAGARGRLTESAAVHRRVRDQEGLAYCLDGLAAVCLAQGDPRTAARLSGAATAARAEVGVTVWPMLRTLADGFEQTLRSALGEEEDRRQRAAGAALGPWQALEEGLAAISEPG